MANPIYIETKSLPDPIALTLRSLGFKRPTIAIYASEKAYIGDCGEQGRRGFAVLLNLETGETKHFQGSWGGSNMFSPTNAVDLDHNSHALPANGCVINGSEGYKGTRASVTVHPSRIAPLLPASTGDGITPRQALLLSVYAGLNSRGRREYFDRHGIDSTPTLAELEAMQARGWIKVSKAGAVSVTPAGRNMRNANPVRSIY
jgi:hypothetical protein